MRITRSNISLRDIEDCILWSAQNFGEKSALRYKKLIEVSISEIADDFQLLGSRPFFELGEGIHVYHIRHSRKRAGVGGITIKKPRHFIVYRKIDAGLIEIVRVLYDGMDII